MVSRTYSRRLSLMLLYALLGTIIAACGGPPIGLTGTITDAYASTPVAGATVKLGSATATTDAQGRYNFAQYTIKDTLQVEAAGYEPASRPLEGQPQFAKPAAPAVTLDLPIRPNTLTGSITDSASGQPLSGAVVKAGDALSATTDAEGRYTLNGVPESFSLSVTAPDHDSVTQDLQRLVSFDTALRPNTLTGVITDGASGKPLSGVAVSAGGVSATTDAEGRYRLQNVPQDATVEIKADGYAAVSQPVGSATTIDTVLEGNVLTGVVTDFYTGTPVKGATVKAGDLTATTGDDGRYRIVDAPKNATVEIDAEGYAAASQQTTDLKPVDAVLRPDVLTSQVVDGTTGTPIKNATIIATETLTGTDVAFVRLDNSADGRFKLEGIPEKGYVQVLAPGYLKATFELKPQEVPGTIKLEPFQVKALYITAAVASAGTDYVGEYLDLIDNTELNSIVIDLKSDLRDDLGLVYYDSQTPMVKELKTSADYVDMPALVAEAKKRGIYTIARVQLFSHDNALADARPDWAIKDRATGKVYADIPGAGIRYAWLDPWNRNVWEYNIALGVEAAQMGFDEINYDYIRYPDFSDLATYKDEYEFSQPTDPKNDGEAMYNNIATFAETAHRKMNGAGAFMSVDVFGRVVLKPSLPIAQDIPRLASRVDYISPMPYPSLWWVGYLDFANPTAHPYEVIKGSLESAVPFFEGKYAKLRPWLQDHTDPWQGSRVVEYGPKEVRAQIDATEDVPAAVGWMLYDSANTYTEGALRPEQ